MNPITSIPPPFGFVLLSSPTTLNGLTYSGPVFLFGLGSDSPEVDTPYLTTTSFLEWDHGGNLTINFNKSVTSFGLDFGQLLEQQEPTPITFTFSNGIVTTADSATHDFSFLGLTSDTPFSSVEIAVDILPVIDNIAIGDAHSAVTPVPEPSTYGLVGAITLLGCAAMRRRALRR